MYYSCIYSVFSSIKSFSNLSGPYQTERRCSHHRLHITENITPFLLHRLPPCFLANLLPYFRYRRVPKSVPKFVCDVPKNVSWRIYFPNPYFWQVPTCHKALIYQASGNFPKSGCFLKTNLSIFWGTPHYSPRGNFLYPET